MSEPAGAASLSTSASDGSRRSAATFIGFLAILMWSLLALFTAASGTVPPFQLAAMSFIVGSLVGLV